MFDLVGRADHEELLQKLEKISAQHKQDMEDLRASLSKRISELEEEVSTKLPIASYGPPKEEEKPSVVNGWIPPSVRKRQFEQSHRKDLSAKKKP